MTIGNDTVKSNLVQIRRLKFQHLVNAIAIDRVCSLSYLLRGTIGTAEASGNQLFAILVEQVESILVGANRYFDELCEAISDLCRGQGAQETEVKECPYGRMVSTESVLVIAVIDRDFDGD